MRVIGLVLVVVGVVGLVFGGLTYTKRQRDVDFGPLVVRHVERESIPIPPIVAGAALVAGALLLVRAQQTRHHDA